MTTDTLSRDPSVPLANNPHLLRWVEKMRHALRLAGSRFTARRMMREYVQEYYAPAIQGEASGDDPPTA